MTEFRWLPGLGRALGTVLVLVAGCVTDATEAPAPRNVVVITIDTLRADHVGRRDDSLTPRIDAFARRGHVFADTVAPMGTTFPSHSSMFTGLYPPRHGVRSNFDSLPPEARTLAETLRRRGFATGAFVSFKSMIHRGGLGQGFAAKSAPKRGRRAKPIRPGEETVDAALAWFAHTEGPFFLWVHLFEPHLPLPLTAYAAERLGAYQGTLADGASVAEVMSMRGTWKDAPDETAALRALYAGRVLEADALFGRVIDALEQRGALDETLVVLASDHGELLGERGEIGHGTAYEAAIRVPLILAGPGIGAGRTETRAGLVDLTPTILEIVGAPVPGGLDGRSLAPALRGERLAPATYFAEARVPKNPGAGTDPIGEPPNGVAAWRGTTKVVATEEAVEVFDLARDPDERRPLPPNDETSLALAAAARAYGVEEARSNVVPVDERTAAELRALGYVE